jgi:eukaryotic-like serine/threonine-protein kinase
VRNSKTRLTSDPAVDAYPVWSPDGRWIAFSSTRLQAPGLYRKAANGAGTEELLLRRTGTLHLYDWSRDGKYLLVAMSGFAARDLFAVPAEGERKPIPLVQTQFRDDQGRFSPDGRFFAYKSNETGRDQIYVQPFPPGNSNQRWTVSDGVGTQPRWSRDGKKLFYMSEGALMVAEVRTTPIFSAGLPKLLFPTAIVGRAGGAPVTWDLTPDGKQIVAITEDQPNYREPLTVVLNWQAGIKR